MPYTKEELQSVGFYNSYIDKIRGEYLSGLIQAAKNNFRNTEGVFISYEDIETGLGIEDAQINDNSEYSTLTTELNRAGLEAEDFGLEQGEIGGAGASAANPYGDDFVSASEGVQSRIENFSKSIQNKQYPIYDELNLNQVIDRNISELVDFGFATSLPDGVKNGDIITNDQADNTDKWLIEGFQKRKFPNLYSFYGEGYQVVDLVRLTDEQIESIPNGEDLI